MTTKRGQVKITTDEWLAELQALSAHSDEGYTAHEWAERAGCSHRVVLDRLKQAQRLGWLRLGFRTDTRIDGKAQKVPVYRIEKPVTKRKAPKL